MWVPLLQSTPFLLPYTPSPPAPCCVHITIQFSFVRQSFCVYMKIVFVVFFLFCFLLFLVLFFQHFHCTFLQPNKFFDKQLTEIDKRTSNGPANVWRAHTRQTETETERWRWREGPQLTVCLSLQLIDRSQSQSRQSDRKQNRLLCLPACPMWKMIPAVKRSTYRPGHLAMLSRSLSHCPTVPLPVVCRLSCRVIARRCCYYCCCLTFQWFFSSKEKKSAAWELKRS